MNRAVLLINVMAAVLGSGCMALTPARAPDPIDVAPVIEVPEQQAPIVADVVPQAPPIALLSRNGHESARQRIRRQLAARLDVPSDTQPGYYMDVLQARLQQQLQGVQGQQVRLRRAADSIVIALPGALGFESGSAELAARAIDTLAALAGVLVDYGQVLITVHGHSDAMGAAEANERVSAQRALAVAMFLHRAGVGRERLVAVGHGSSVPIDVSDTEQARERNRRVEVQLELITR